MPSQEVEITVQFECCPVCRARGVDLPVLGPDRVCKRCGYRSCSRCHAGTGAAWAPVCATCDLAIPTCPICKRPLGKLRECWGKKCNYRMCEVCDKDTGSPFIRLCLRCGIKDHAKETSMPSEPLRPSKCRSCGASILWALTGKGKSMPLDAEPSPEGNVVILDGEATVIPKGTRAAGKDHYTSHFVTCPNADQHRRK